MGLNHGWGSKKKEKIYQDFFLHEFLQITITQDKLIEKI